MTDAAKAGTATESGELRLLRRQEVCQRLKCSAWRLHQMVREGTFPRPIKTGVRGTRWVATEVDAWIKARVEERDGGEAAGHEA